MWIYLSLASAFFLGIYDVCRKQAVNENAVLPTLLCTTTCGAIIALGIMLFSYTNPQLAHDYSLYIPALSWHQHGLLIIKSFIVGSSWVCTFFAVKNLPISIVIPIRASAPLWTLLGAVIIFGERFTPLQWLGLAIVFISYYIFSLQGRKEGIFFTRNKWIYFVVGGTLLGAISSLYDKFLMQKAGGFEPVAVLCWFMIYLSIISAITVLTIWFPRRKKYSSFKWKWSMPLVGLFLVTADFIYFQALHDPEALIGIVSALRRTSAIISFIIGVLIFKDVNRRKKGLALLGVMLGVFIILYAKSLL